MVGAICGVGTIEFGRRECVGGGVVGCTVGTNSQEATPAVTDAHHTNAPWREWTAGLIPMKPLPAVRNLFETTMRGLPRHPHRIRALCHLSFLPPLPSPPSRLATVLTPRRCHVTRATDIMAGYGKIDDEEVAAVGSSKLRATATKPSHNPNPPRRSPTLPLAPVAIAIFPPPHLPTTPPPHSPPPPTLLPPH